MIVKLAKIGLSIVAGMLGLVLVMAIFAGTRPAVAMEDVGQDNGGALAAGLPHVVELAASPTEIRADGSSHSTITGTVKDNSGQPVPGAFIAFTTTLGTIDQYCYAEAESASVNKSPGDWTIENYSGASGGQYVRACGTVSPTATLSWTFGASAISMLYIKDADGGVATVRVDGGTPITVDMGAGSRTTAERVITAGLGSGSHIVTVKWLTQSVGYGSCIRIDAFRCGATTNASGQATATLTSTLLSCGSKTATVTALTGGPSILYMITGTKLITMTASAPNSVTVTANPNQIAADRASTSTLQATVRDQFGQYVPDCTMVGFIATDEESAAPGEAWVTLPYKLVEGENPTKVITDGWSIDSNAGYHGGQAIYTNAVGATARWNFTGTAVSLVYAKLSDAGVASVTVDSGLPITIDMYAPSPQYQVEHVITHALTPGPHVITVTVAGYTVTGGTDTRVYVDAFRSGVSTSGGVGEATAVLTSGTKAGVVMVEATAVGRPCCETTRVVTGRVPITLTAGDPYTLTITPTDINTTCCVTSTLQFTVTDRYDNQVGLVVPRTLTVDFTSNPYGVFTPTSVVITNGVGSVIFHAWTAGSGAITGTVRGYPVTDTSRLTVTAGPCYSLTISANPTQIYVTDENTSLLPNFSYTSTITAELKDRCGNAVGDGTVVTFTTSLGSLGSDTITKSTLNGLATAVLTSAQLPAGVPTQTAYITVTGASCPISKTTSVTFGRHIYTLTVTANPNKIKVGGTTSTLIADVKDGFGGSAPDGVTVTFAITPNLATIAPSAKTVGGKATAVLTSGTQPGVATIEAVAIGSAVTNTGLITITAGDPYTLTITPTDVSITCCFTSTLQFTVTDQYSNIVGAVVPETVTVLFTSTPSGVFTPTSSVVVTQGVGSVIFHGYAAGIGFIQGVVAGFYPTATATSNLTVAAGSPVTLTVTRAPTSILADGVATATITATVRDACQNPVCNRVVTFTTELGSFSPPPTTTLSITKTTNCNGVATATLRSGYASRRVYITVTTDSLIGTTYVDMVGVAYNVQLVANPTSILVGGYTSNLTATVHDQFGNPVVDGTVVTFTTSLGSVGSSTTTKTTVNGIARAVLTSSNTAGTATITAAAGSGTAMATDTVTVTFRAGPPYAVTLVAYPITPMVGGSSSLTATVRDQYNNLVADGTIVTFTTSLGSLGGTPLTKTTASGIATATLTSSVAGTAVVTATADSKYGTASVTFLQPGLPYTLTLVAYPMTLTVEQSATLTATVKDHYNNPVADGTVVTFTTSLGSVGSISVTKMTTNGIATATLTSQSPGTATITATAGLTSATTAVFFKAGLPYTVTLQAYPTSIPVAGYTSTLTATVKDRYDNNVANGTVVTFATSLGNLGGVPVTKTTINGVATAILTSGTTAGTAIVTATSDSRVATTTVRFMPLSPYTVTLVAYPTSLPVGSTSTLTVTARDQYNNNVADGTVVTFETSLGSVGSAIVTKTTTNGVALATLTSQIPGTATITATTDSKVVTTAVTFRPGLPYTITLVASPMSLTVGNTSSLTATVTDQYSNTVADGTIVTFTTSLGSLGAPVTRTTVSGVVTTTLTSQVAGTAVVTATSDSKYGKVNVTFNPDLPYTLVITAYPTSIPIGWFTSTITATVKDQYSNPVADGTEVTFAADLGSIGSSSVTKLTQNGVATATLTSGLVIGTANISATCGSLIGHTQVIFTRGAPFTVTVESWPPTIEVGGNTATITATVIDIGGYTVADGTAVVFTTDLGSLGSSTVTKYTTNGIAIATLTAGLTPGVAHITVTAGSKSATAMVKIAPGPPASIQVIANPTYIPIGGAASLITATVKDQYGNNVVNGTIVNFATTLGSVSPESGATNEGVAVTTLTSGLTMGTARVTASSGAAVGSVDVLFTVGPPFYINVVANPTAIGLNGQTSNILATVKDVGGNNVADGTLVTFATNLGILGSNIVTKTTAGGIANAVLTSQTKAGTAIITATADSKFNTTTVIIIPDPPYTVTLTANPVAIPANGVSTSRIAARVTDRYGNAVVDGTLCNFHTTLGSISPSYDTTLNGVAETTLTAAESPGLATVTATCDGKQGTNYVVFYSVFEIYLPMVLKAY